MPDSGSEVEQAVAALHHLRREALAQLETMGERWRQARLALIEAMVAARQLEIPVRDCAAASGVSSATAQRWTVELIEERFRISASDSAGRSGAAAESRSEEPTGGSDELQDALDEISAQAPGPVID